MSQSHQDYMSSLDRCSSCSQPITGNKKTSVTTKKAFHAECFACTRCRTALGSGAFYEDASGLYCATHWAERQGNTCAGCNSAVSGKIVSAVGKKFHPGCFVCSRCRSPLGNAQFAVVDNQLQCSNCAK